MQNQKLAQLLQQIAYCEKNVELARKDLAKLDYFNSETAFKLLDVDDNLLVDNKELQHFLNKHGVKSTQEERQHILNLVHSDQPKKGIDYQAFLKIFLPQTSKSFTQKAKKQIIVDEDEEVDENIEKVVGLFLMKEIEMYNYLETQKVNYFKTDNRFLNISTKLSGRITYADLQSFMKSHKLSFNVSDWKALLRRANCMGEGHLTQCDLNKLVSKENRTEVDAMPFIQNVIGANIQSSLQKSYSPVKNSSFAGGILKNALRNQIPANLSQFTPSQQQSILRQSNVSPQSRFNSSLLTKSRNLNAFRQTYAPPKNEPFVLNDVPFTTSVMPLNQRSNVKFNLPPPPPQERKPYDLTGAFAQRVTPQVNVYSPSQFRTSNVLTESLTSQVVRPTVSRYLPQRGNAQNFNKFGLTKTYIPPPRNTFDAQKDYLPVQGRSLYSPNRLNKYNGMR